jgi:dTDP-4-dehydrorhamnose 3,5-epimerase
VQYKVTAPYAPSCEFGLAWNDPDLAIRWPVSDKAPLLSEKDSKLPRLRDLPPYFE